MLCFAQKHHLLKKIYCPLRNCLFHAKLINIKTLKKGRFSTLCAFRTEKHSIQKGIETMNFLEERIMKDGIVKEGNVLKVDSFLNHQMDIRLFDEMGAEWKRRFAGNRSTRS